MEEKVLVTGANGYLAGFIIMELLRQGFAVSGTVRSDAGKEQVLRDLTAMGAANLERLTLHEAELGSDAGWQEAMEGASYVIHTAHPSPGHWAMTGEEKAALAAAGAERVLSAARAAGVKRVVLTSCTSAVYPGHKHHEDPFTEADWPDLSDNGIPVDEDSRAKMLEEQKAWEFAEKNGLELVTVLPAILIGPALADRFSRQSMIIRAMLLGQLSHLLRQSFNYADARDAAVLHVLALTRPEAAGQRFIAAADEYVSYRRMAEILKEGLGDKASRVTLKELPNLAAKALALLLPDLRTQARYLGINTAVSAAKAKKLLGWEPRSAEESILDCANDMIRLKRV